MPSRAESAILSKCRSMWVVAITPDRIFINSLPRETSHRHKGAALDDATAVLVAKSSNLVHAAGVRDATQLWPLAARLAGAFALVDSGGRSGEGRSPLRFKSTH